VYVKGKKKGDAKDEIITGFGNLTCQKAEGVQWKEKYKGKSQTLSVTAKRTSSITRLARDRYFSSQGSESQERRKEKPWSVEVQTNARVSNQRQKNIYSTGKRRGLGTQSDTERDKPFFSTRMSGLNGNCE